MIRAMHRPTPPPKNARGYIYRRVESDSKVKKDHSVHSSMKSWRRLACLSALALALAWCEPVRPLAAEESLPGRDRLADLSLEELMDVRVTTVSKKPETRLSAAEPVYVLTGEEIRRSGVTTIPDALRLVPGVQVARVTSNSWAIGIRGFASRLARSVLVLMDGRTVYNPLFAGTYWELQDTVLEDIERIEVIRGPGGTLWGANAFNGVINIITRDSAETQGGLLIGRGGSEEQGTGIFRYGGAWLDGKLHYRAWAKYFNRDGGGGSGEDSDDWGMARGGFRADWRPVPSDWWTLQGDIYDGELGTSGILPQFDPPVRRPVVGNADVSGGDILGRWSRTLGRQSDVSVQLYYDHTFRRDLNFRDERDTIDLDAQHRFRFDLLRPHEVVWGLEYRFTTDDTHGIPGLAFHPSHRTDNLFAGFLQNETTLIPSTLRLTLGTKIEHNDYSGVEVQPHARLLYTPHSAHTLWASVGRSVRTPSRFEHDPDITLLPVPADCSPPSCVYPRLVANPEFKPETLIAYQLGYRVQPVSRLFVDAVGFYQVYDDLLSIESRSPFVETSPAPPHTVAPFALGNKISGESFGAELAVDFLATDWWRLRSGYSYLRINLRRAADSVDPTVKVNEDSSPQNQVFVSSELDLPWNLELDSDFRYVDSLPGLDVSSYVTFDVRLELQVTDQIAIAGVGRDLWDSQHREFPLGSEVQRSAYGQVRYQW